MLQPFIYIYIYIRQYSRLCILIIEVPPLKGLNKYTITNNPGRKPWAMQEYRPKGLNISCETIPFFQSKYRNKYEALTQTR